jgi:hypothetical protein
MLLLRHALGRVRRQGSLAGDIARHCRPRRPHLDLRLFPKMININSLRQWHFERRNRDRICAGAAKGRVTLDQVRRELADLADAGENLVSIVVPIEHCHLKSPWMLAAEVKVPGRMHRPAASEIFEFDDDPIDE